MEPNENANQWDTLELKKQVSHVAFIVCVVTLTMVGLSLAVISALHLILPESYRWLSVGQIRDVNSALLFGALSYAVYSFIKQCSDWD